MFAPSLPILAFWSPGPGEMLVIGVIALLLYGGDLPRVARSWGKTLAEFRRGLSGIQDEINDAIYTEPDPAPKLEYHPEYHKDDPTDDSDQPIVIDAVKATDDSAVDAGGDSDGEVDAAAGDSVDDYGFDDRAVTEATEAERARRRDDAADVPSD